MRLLLLVCLTSWAAPAQDPVREQPPSVLKKALAVSLDTRAMLYNRFERYDLAFRDASAVLQYNPRSAAGYYHLAYADAGLGRREESLEALRLAASLNEERYGECYRAAAAVPAGERLMRVFSASAVRETSPGLARVGSSVWLPGPDFQTYMLGAWVLLGIGAIGFARRLWKVFRTKAEETPAEAGPPARSASLPQPAESRFWTRYSVVREIAAGGMGVVYEALDRKLDRKVAIKQMRHELAGDSRARERFLAEARTVAKMRHPAIVDIYSIEEDGENDYLVFELIDGRTLAEVIRERGRLTLGQARDVFRSVCEALAYAHERGVIHRDLKPANVMVHAGGVKVMDFGVARQAKNSGGLMSVTDTVCGTPPYMAPEEERGIVGRETDIFALGVCLYESLTGRLPFDPAAGSPLLLKLSAKYVPATQAIPGLPRSVDPVIARALDPEPGRRFHSAREFLDALEESIPGG